MTTPRTTELGEAADAELLKEPDPELLKLVDAVLKQTDASRRHIVKVERALGRLAGYVNARYGLTIAGDEEGSPR